MSAGIYVFHGLSIIFMEGYVIDVATNDSLYIFGGTDRYFSDIPGENGPLNIDCLVLGIAVVLLCVAIRQLMRMILTPVQQRCIKIIFMISLLAALIVTRLTQPSERE